MKFLPAIKKLYEEGPANPEHGMCINLENMGVERPYHVIADLAESWPYYSGNRHYPIHDKTDDSTPAEQFEMADPWFGNQLRLRRSFMRHAIKTLEEQES